jgi:plastocyanin
MRRTLLLPAAIAAAALVGACSSSSAPAWTYAAPTPEPSAQPAASGGSAAPGASAPASAVPGSQVPGSQAPASGGTAAGPVQISAQGVQFEQKDVATPAGAAFTIHFDNKDAGQPHNVDIKDASGASVFKGNIITGPAAADYQVPALTAGTYTFVCDVHSNMTGTLTAG